MPNIRILSLLLIFTIISPLTALGGFEQ